MCVCDLLVGRTRIGCALRCMEPTSTSECPPEDVRRDAGCPCDASRPRPMVASERVRASSSDMRTLAEGVCGLLVWLLRLVRQPGLGRHLGTSLDWFRSGLEVRSGLVVAWGATVSRLLCCSRLRCLAQLPCASKVPAAPAGRRATPIYVGGGASFGSCGCKPRALGNVCCHRLPKASVLLVRIC